MGIDKRNVYNRARWKMFNLQNFPKHIKSFILISWLYMINAPKLVGSAV